MNVMQAARFAADDLIARGITTHPTLVQPAMHGVACGCAIIYAGEFGVALVSVAACRDHARPTPQAHLEAVQAACRAAQGLDP